MATIQQLAELRLAIKEPDNAEPYTDDFLNSLIDQYTVDGAAGRIWRAKAAQVSHLVDISEGGSSRSMSQVFKQYTENAIGFEESAAAEATPTNYAPRSRKATRV